MGAKEVNVLMVTYALQSHMNPLLKLAKCLAGKGAHVILAANEVARHRMINSNISTTQNAENPTIQLEFFSDGLSLDFDRNKNFGQFMESLQTEGLKNLSNLITNLSIDRKFSCIIINPFFPWVVEVAHNHGIPCAVLWIEASIIYAIYYHYYKDPNRFSSFENPNDIVELPGMPTLQVKDIPTFIMPSDPPYVRQMLSYLVEHLDKVKWILGNSFNDLEHYMVNSMAFKPIIHIGPLVSPFLLGREEILAGSVDMWSAEDSCLEWLDKKAPSSVIYISFGSLVVLSQKRMDNIAMALKNSNRPFLWVIKPPEKGFENLAGVLPSGFMEETKERGMMVAWCSQEKVLMHQAVACFMTHCGWNSTIETVVTGVPVIAYPAFSDQLTNAKLLVDVFKMGVRMYNDEDGAVSIKEVERCIMEVTDGPMAAYMKQRAMELKEAAKMAVAEGGSSDQNIDKFISEIYGKSC